MDSDLESAVTATLEALKELPQRLEADVNEVQTNYARVEAQCRTKSSALSTELNQLETRLNDIRKALESERENSLRLSTEFERLKEANKLQSVSLEERFAELRTRYKSISLGDFEALEQRSEELREEVDYLGSKLSLYCSCTCIRWDYENAQSVSGYMLTKTEAQKFSFPLQPGQSRLSFDQVNQLWELLR